MEQRKIIRITIIRMTIIAIYARQRKIITPKDFDLEAPSGHP